MRVRTSLLVATVMAAGVVAAACAPTPGGTWLAAGCYNSPVADAPDFRFSGSANAKGNLTVALDIATLTLSTDGSCSGVPLGDPYSFTLVRAASASSAEALCSSLGLDNGVGQIQADYPSFPEDAWVCNPDVTT